MKKKVIAILLSAVTVMSLIGCGNAAAPAADAAAPAAEEAAPAAEEAAPAAEEAAPESIGESVEGELSVTIWDAGQRPGLQQIVDEWSAQSGVQATIQVVDWNNYWTLLEAGATGGELPDVFWMHSNVAQKYMENDQLMDLTDRIAGSDKIDLS
ncbi:MAG: sugar ABC transporter substrate-binding protein, partial [Lachnospiraceae bacterium]|nr:sugar ABC transporter substrate-binding protein [Lachnospiraceae bacterium]